MSQIWRLIGKMVEDIKSPFMKFAIVLTLCTIVGLIILSSSKPLDVYSIIALSGVVALTSILGLIGEYLTIRFKNDAQTIEELKTVIRDIVESCKTSKMTK